MTLGPWLIGLVALVAIGLLIFLIAYGYHDYKINNQPIPPNSLPPCNTDVDIDSLIQLPAGGQLCSGTNLYYIASLDLVVAPFPTPAASVCVQFCDSLTKSNGVLSVNGVCTGSSANAQILYNQCLAELTSTTCTPPIPLAALGTTLYYANSPTDATC